jgi:hypothetical protein
MNIFGRAGMIAAGLAALVMLAGCQRGVSALDTRSDPLPPAPVGTVQSTPLDPAAPAAIAPAPGQQVAATDPNALPPADGGVPGAQQTATPPPPTPSTTPITRESLAGTWTVASDNPECRIILAFTKWSGGYRAATRRCNTPEISTVTAWDVRENLVVLVDAGGNQVASLASVGPERYDGTTAGGKPVTFSR